MSKSIQLPLAIVVESDEETRVLIKGLLELMGFVVLEAGDVEEAYQSAVYHQPNLILIELSRPLVSGFSAIRRIKKVSELSQTQIIAMSSLSHGKLAMAAGCAAHVQKPIEFGHLESVVESLVQCEPLAAVSFLVH